MGKTLWRKTGLLLLLLGSLAAIPLFAVNTYTCQVYQSGTGRVCTRCEFTTPSGGSGYFISCED